MIKKLFEVIYGREYELRERIFRMLILIGGSILIMGIVECLIIMDVKLIVIPMTGFLLVLIAVLLITFKYHKIDMSAAIVAFLIILVIFPAMFF